MVRLALYEPGSCRRILQAFGLQPEDVQLLWQTDNFYMYSETMRVFFSPGFIL